MYKRGSGCSALKKDSSWDPNANANAPRLDVDHGVTYSQVGGVGVGLPVGILKPGYGITKAIGDHETKRAIKIGEKPLREVASGKRKRYAGESFNCSIM